MKRLVLVLFVCLSVQMSALSAPFVHLHADAGHETDHHDGRAVHRHMAPDDQDAGDHHEGETDSDNPVPQDDGGIAETSPEPSVRFLGTSIAGLVASESDLAPSDSALHGPTLRPVLPPQHDVGPLILAPPDFARPSPRGPPR